MPAIAGAVLRWSQEWGSEFPVGATESQEMEPSPAASQDAHWQEAGSEVEAGLYPRHSDRGCGVPRGSLTHCAGSWEHELQKVSTFPRTDQSNSAMPKLYKHDDLCWESVALETWNFIMCQVGCPVNKFTVKTMGTESLKKLPWWTHFTCAVITAETRFGSLHVIF